MISSIAELIAYLRRFHRARSPDPSMPSVEIPDGLPPSLSAIYRELGALIALERPQVRHGRAPFSAQDRLLPVSRLRLVDDMFEFAWENQGNWSARCPASVGDPAVYSNAHDVWNSEQRGFIPVCESLAHFLTTLCLQEAIMSCQYLVAIDGNRLPSETLTQPATPLWCRGRYVEEEPSHDFWHVNHADIMVMNCSETTWIGSPVNDIATHLAPGLRATPIS